MRYATPTRNLLSDFDLDGFLGLPKTRNVWSPAYELEEFEDRYHLHFDLPGFNKDNIDLEVKEGVLVVSGERKKETKTKGYSERFYGTFTRSFSLPENVNTDDLNASYENGVLSVDIPRVVAEGPKKVAIR